MGQFQLNILYQLYQYFKRQEDSDSTHLKTMEPVYYCFHQISQDL